MQNMTQSATKAILQNSADKQVSNLARDTVFVTALTDVLNASLKIAEKFPQTKAELVSALVKKGVSLSKLAATTTGSKNLELANFAATQTLKTVGLKNIAGMTPVWAATFITLTMAEKVVSRPGWAK